MSATLTIFFDEPFYAALVERTEGGETRAAKFTFGAEPSEAQVLAWVNRVYPSLALSPGVSARREAPVAANPKRRQRQAAKALQTGIGTRSQQALQLAREQSKTERCQASRERREAEEERRYQRSQEKRREKHRGH